MSDANGSPSVDPLPAEDQLPDEEVQGVTLRSEIVVFSKEEAVRLKQMARAYPVIRKLVNSRLQWEAVGAMGEFIKKWLVSMAVIGTSVLAGKAYLFDAIRKGAGE